MPRTNQLDHDLEEALNSQAVQVDEPREHMVQLRAVAAGAGFSKPATNVLLCRQEDFSWRVFVDDDFAYLGGDGARRRLFSGPQRNRWRELTPPEPLRGDLNGAILRVLGWLDSPVQTVVPVSLRPGDRLAAPAEVAPELQRTGRFLDREQLRALAIGPTPSQAEAIARIAGIVLRRALPAWAVLCGPSGCGKSAVAATAALALVERGVVQQVFEFSGAAVCSGAIFWPQRDERLRAALELLRELPQSTLVLLEQFDLALGKSETALSLVGEALDRGIRLIAVARPEFAAEHAEALGLSLSRRLELVTLAAPDYAELQQILRQWLQRHPLAQGIEVAPEVVPAALRLAPLRPGANPGAALGLLEAALAHVAWAELKILGPDELYHLVPPEPEE